MPQEEPEEAEQKHGREEPNEDGEDDDWKISSDEVPITEADKDEEDWPTFEKEDPQNPNTEWQE